ASLFAAERDARVREASPRPSRKSGWPVTGLWLDRGWTLPTRDPTGRPPIGIAARGTMVDVASSVQSWDLSSVRRDLSDAPLLRAANAAGPEHTPVWFMRQAGRSLPEYRALREGVPML